ncbi:polysaccharide pyruvyl transferase family protein [Kocuria rosea]|uniref:polysaccharide pyruvyl transferase family protein n=1 Tax=Kocuria rosea TaxID=1275 RepID=UPI0025419C20|nr:polysaccharide pyruvyl transferase family protein [Kocuria rosea]WIG16366.1 polysaccharide pyruvyl transferase family protein [Kocuria rosea]
MMSPSISTGKKSAKKILVIGAEFVNQGARLMMDAVVDEITSRYMATPVLEHTVGTAAEKQSIGALSLMPYRLQRAAGVHPVSRMIETGMGVVSPRNLTAVFDASGFRYGDQWKQLDLMRTAEILSWYSSIGVPVYALPQAFGPFKETGDAATRMLGASRLVYARDPESESYLKQLQPSATNIRVSPDFTGKVSGKEVLNKKHLVGAVPIIPNWNIINRAADAESANRYMGNLITLVNTIRRDGFRVYGLSHEGDQDGKILRDLAGLAGGEFEIVEGLDGGQIKWLIGTAPVVVSGRYHAIASALSQGVPTLAHGWSHKYEWLLKDYGSAGGLTDPYGSHEEQEASWLMAVSSPSQSNKDAATTVSNRVEAMWDEIGSDLDMLSQSNWKDA